MRGGFFAVALACTGLAGCGSQPLAIMDRSDYLAEATRIYANEDKERVIQAAEIVMKQSDPGNVEMRYTPNGFTALRKFFVYAVLATQRGREKWEFSVEPQGSASLAASLSVSEAAETTGGYGDVHRSENALNSVPLYRLFWKRVDYMLGRRAEWASCSEEAAELQARGISSAAALGGLCGPTSGGRDLPPPAALGPRRAIAVAGTTSGKSDRLRAQ